MARRKKVRIDRVIILILAAILVLGVLGFGIYKTVGLLFTENNESHKEEHTHENEHHEDVPTTDNIKIELIDYDVYKDDTDKLGFNFAVVELKFEANDPINFDLSNLETSEKISLSSVDKYLKQLQEEGYKTNKLEIVDYVSSSEKSTTVKIFVPIISSANAIQIYNLNNPTINISLDLDENNLNITSLKFDTTHPIDVDNTSVVVSSSSISTMMMHNDEEYNIPSTIKIFTFKIMVNDVEDNVCIEEAHFIKDGDDTPIPCMSSEYNSVKVANIIGKPLVKGENGALFFETYCVEDNPSKSGILILKFSNSDVLVEVPTSLE